MAGGGEAGWGVLVRVFKGKVGGRGGWRVYKWSGGKGKEEGEVRT